MTTTNFILRDYKIEFTRGGKHDSLMMTPQEMLPLLDAERGTIHVRDGAFGWPWIERVVPRIDNLADLLVLGNLPFGKDRSDE